MSTEVSLGEVFKVQLQQKMPEEHMTVCSKHDFIGLSPIGNARKSIQS